MTVTAVPDGPGCGLHALLPAAVETPARACASYPNYAPLRRSPSPMKAYQAFILFLGWGRGESKLYFITPSPVRRGSEDWTFQVETGILACLELLQRRVRQAGMPVATPLPPRSQNVQSPNTLSHGERGERLISVHEAG